MGTITQFRLPGGEPRRQPTERRNDVIAIDSRRSLIDPSRAIKVPVLRRPRIYDWADELDE